MSDTAGGDTARPRCVSGDNQGEPCRLLPRGRAGFWQEIHGVLWRTKATRAQRDELLWCLGTMLPGDPVPRLPLGQSSVGPQEGLGLSPAQRQSLQTNLCFGKPRIGNTARPRQPTNLYLQKEIKNFGLKACGKAPVAEQAPADGSGMRLNW